MPSLDELLPLEPKLDFDRLYPSIMKTYNICYTTLRKPELDDDEEDCEAFVTDSDDGFNEIEEPLEMSQDFNHAELIQKSLNTMPDLVL